jgi:hypothetical protein
MVVWTCKNYPLTKIQSNSYSWVLANDNNGIEAISEKFLPENNSMWYPICGNFSSSSIDLLKELIALTLSDTQLSESEIHLEAIIRSALKANVDTQILDVSKFFTVGTPAEYELELYWS